jgi:plastocyanin
LGLAILVILGTTACGANDEAPGVVVAGAHTLVVRMTDEMRFVPEHPIIGVGDTVIWTNSGRIPEWSIPVDGSSTSFACPGTTPTSVCSTKRLAWWDGSR